MLGTAIASAIVAASGSDLLGHPHVGRRPGPGALRQASRLQAKADANAIVYAHLPPTPCGPAAVRDAIATRDAQASEASSTETFVKPKRVRKPAAAKAA